MSTVITDAAKSYIATFDSFQSTFMHWGETLFFSLLTINLVWIGIWCAIEKRSLEEAFAEYLKKLFICTIFYTILLNADWLESLLSGAEEMGKQLNGTALDPSSIISKGIQIANLIIKPVNEMGLFDASFGLLIAVVVYVVTLYIFINIALEVALTLIMTMALITVATFLLGFGGLGATTAIARQTLDTVLAYCVKLLGFYLVVSAGLTTFGLMTNNAFFPSTPEALEQGGFDSYVWLIAVAGLFYMLAKNLPEQMAKMVSNGIQESRGTSMTAAALSAIKLASQSMKPQEGSPVHLAGQAAKTVAKLASAAATGTAGFAANMAKKAYSSMTGGIKSAGNTSSASSNTGHSVPNSSKQ